MRNYYYVIWLTYIGAAIRNPKKNDSWKINVWILMSFFNAFNYAAVAIILDWLGVPVMWAHLKYSAITGLIVQ